MDPSSDENLAKRSQSGDMRALEELLRKYLHLFYRLALCMCRNEKDAEEAAQESGIRIIEVINKFDTKRLFKPWAMWIAHNVILNYAEKLTRRASVWKELSNPGYVENNKKEDDPSILAERREMCLRLRNAIDRLPEPGKTCYILRKVLELPHKDVQEILHWTKARVNYHLHKSSTQVNNELENLR